MSLKQQMIGLSGLDAIEKQARGNLALRYVASACNARCKRKDNISP